MMDPFNTQFLLILAPVLLIVVLFLSFWLLTREASYDEALARHRRQVGLSLTTPAATSWKGDRKKSKKKDCGVVSGGERYGSDSDSELRDLELMDMVATSVKELSAALETPSPADTPPALRNRRKKKPRQPTAEDPASTCKSQSPLPFSKLPSPPPAEPANRKKESERKQRNEADDLQLDTRVDQDPVPVAKNTLETMETKPNKGPTSQDTHTSPISGGKRRSSSKKQKAELVLVDEPLIQATVYIPLMDRDTGAPTHSHSEPTSPTKTNHRKQNKEPNKENSWMKLEEVLSCLRRLPLATEEVSSVVAVLSESCPSGLEAWLKSKVDSHPWAQQLQERENQLTMLKREVSVTQGNVKQLRQELQAEKQKTGRVEALHQERCGVLEQELSTLRAQTQSSQQGAQATQTKLQQLEEKASQLENENGILRDAVSRASKQRESEQAAQLSRLRLEHTASLQELAEKSTKLQQEEGQRKNLEAQLQDAKSRWEEVQSFLHNANTEKEKLQAIKQELQAQLLLAESEMNSKNQEIQSLHSNLTDTMVSKDQLEQKVLMLMESTQCGRSEDTRQIQDLLTENKSLHVQMEALQSQVASQASRLTHFEELQRLLAEKEMQRKSLEDSLNVERSISAGRESDMQGMHSENLRLKAALQRLQAQLSEQAASQLVLDQFQKSVQEKDEKIRRTVEDLLEASLAKIAEKEEELKVQEEEVKRLREESVTLKQEVEALGSTEQAPMQATVEDLLKTVEEKEGRLEAELQIRSAQEETIKALEQQVEALGAELEQRGLREAEELQELQARLSAREEEMQSLKRAMEEAVQNLANQEQQLQALQLDQGQLEKQQGPSEGLKEDMIAALAERDMCLSELQCEAAELQQSLEVQRRKNNELREKNWAAMEALSATESLLLGKLDRTTKESQRALESARMECREALHRLLPSIPLPRTENHQEWLQEFESAAQEADPVPCIISESQDVCDTKVWEEKLRESEEAQRVLLKNCDTYKKVLGETEGILQRLQSSVEQEEMRWRVKLEVSQREQRELSLKVVAVERERDELMAACGELENVRLDKQHLASELEKAKRDGATYVAEVNKLQAQLTLALCRLEAGENQRQKVAGDLSKAQRSLDLIQVEIQEEAPAADLIENSHSLTQRDGVEERRKEKMAAGLYQTVRELQQLLLALNKQLTTGQEGDGNGRPTVEV